MKQMRALLVTGSLLGFAPCAVGQTPAQETLCQGAPVVEFDHKSSQPVLIASLVRQDGERFVFRVVNTEPASFTYTVMGVEAAPQPPPGAPRTAAPDTTHEECVKHSKRFGGYVMTVAKIEGKDSELRDKTFIVYVDTPGWNLDFAGAFTVSGLRDPVFALSPAGDNTFRVIRDNGERDNAKESAVRLGVAAFINVYRDGWNLGPSFGFGIGEGQDPTYYFGATWRLGNVAGITGGVAIGGVTTLPPGIKVDDVVTDPNTLTKPSSRVAAAAFVSVSFQFLGSDAPLKKPFAGETGAK